MIELVCRNEEVEFTYISFNVPLYLALSIQTTSCTVSSSTVFFIGSLFHENTPPFVK